MVTALKGTETVESMLQAFDVYQGTGSSELAILASDKGALEVFEQMVFTCAICDAQLDDPRAVLCPRCIDQEGL